MKGKCSRMVFFCKLVNLFFPGKTVQHQFRSGYGILLWLSMLIRRWYSTPISHQAGPERCHSVFVAEKLASSGGLVPAYRGVMHHVIDLHSATERVMVSANCGNPLVHPTCDNASLNDGTMDSATLSRRDRKSVV